MIRALIVLHGNKTDISGILDIYSSKTLLICADGGAEYAREHNLTPDLVVGDMDSISLETMSWLEQQKVKILKFPRDKDNTDSELAIEQAIEMGSTELIVFGLLGDRVDHMSANMMYLSTVAERASLCIIEGDQEIFFVKTSIELKGKKKDEVSLIPLKSECKGISTEGLEYVLTNASLPFGSTRGVSNVMNESKAVVLVKEGVLMVVHRYC